MHVAYANGVRIGRLTVDPTGFVPAAFWTHRPGRRAPSGRTLAAARLAESWENALGLPLDRGAIAMGHRIELLPTGYGPGGAALLLSDRGHRTLVVGPTTERLQPRAVDRLVLNAARAPNPPVDWLERVRAGEVERLVVPDGGAGMLVVDALRAMGVQHRCPRWLGKGRRGAGVTVSTRGPGLEVDARPQASTDWLVRFALAVGPEQVLVHGDEADAVAGELAGRGLSVRVLHGPTQLALAGLDGGEAPAPYTNPSADAPPPEDEAGVDE